MKSPIRVAITGAAGQIGYALVFRLASGEIFGADACHHEHRETRFAAANVG